MGLTSQPLLQNLGQHCHRVGWRNISPDRNHSLNMFELNYRPQSNNSHWKIVFSGQIDRTQQFDGQNHLSPYIWMVFWMVKTYSSQAIWCYFDGKNTKRFPQISPPKSTQRSWKGAASSYKLVYNPHYHLVISHSYWKWPFIVSFPIENGDFL